MTIGAVGLAVGVAALAGCGGSGGSSSTMPSTNGAGLSPMLNGGPGNLGSNSTLYVSGQGAVYAYDLTTLKASAPGSTVTTAPLGTNSGYYTSGGNSQVASIATDGAGNLVVLENINVTSGTETCRLVYLAARTGTTGGAGTTGACANVNGPINGVGRAVSFSAGVSGVTSDVDVLMHYVGTNTNNGCSGPGQPDSYEVDRYETNGGTFTAHTCYGLVTAARDFLAGSTNGNTFLSAASPSVLERRDSTGTVTATTGAPSGAYGPVAVSANLSNGTGYRVAALTTSGTTVIQRFTVVAGSPGSFNLVSTIGPFNNPVTALAVDNNGVTYVGVVQSGVGTKLKAYGINTTDATTPDYILDQPIRRPNPTVAPAATITGIAIAQ